MHRQSLKLHYVWRSPSLLVSSSLLPSIAMRMTHSITTPEESFKETHDELTSHQHHAHHSKKQRANAQPLRLKLSNSSQTKALLNTNVSLTQTTTTPTPATLSSQVPLDISPPEEVQEHPSACLLPERRNAPCVLLPCTLLQRGT